MFLFIISFQICLDLISFIDSFKYYENSKWKGGSRLFMPRMKKQSSSEPAKKMRPALTPEARENQLISLAVDLAEQQLRDGTASAQVITHYLKLGATTARLEKEKLEKENQLLAAKTKALESAERTEELYANAINAMRSYGGYDNDQNLL